MSRSRLRPYLGPVIALLVVLALGAGTVYAAIPNSNGKVYACYVKNTGAVKLINYPKVSTCPKGETLINWNAKGPQGPAGPVGATGATGPQGPAGPADWNAIPNIPAGFADGADNAGVTQVKLTVKSGSLVSVPVGGWMFATADCTAGYRAIGGGAYSESRWLHLTDSWPDGNRWVAYAHNDDAGLDPPATAHSFKAFAVCMSIEPSGALTTAKFKRAKLRKHN